MEQTLSDQLELRKSKLLGTATQQSMASVELAALGHGPVPLIEDDKDLVPLLRQASNDELAPLVEYIIQKGGITAQLQRTQAYKQHFPNHREYADSIAAEIQKFGANTFWTHAVRHGRGVKYRRILKRVAHKCGVNTGVWEKTEHIERRVLLAILGKGYERMTPTERTELLKTLKLQTIPRLSVPTTAAGLQTLVQASGFEAYKLAVVVANGTANTVVGHGLTFAANAGIAKGLAVFAGPIGWALDAIWGGMIIAGPAYRVSMPCVLQVALIRQSMLHKRRWRRLLWLLLTTVVAALALIMWYSLQHGTTLTLFR